MPKVLYFGQKNTENIMIMELLGPSIESLFNICERHFSIKTVCMIGKQLVRISFFFFFFCSIFIYICIYYFNYNYYLNFRFHLFFIRIFIIISLLLSFLFISI